jgi:uncharacterized protein (DUF1697 family)
MALVVFLRGVNVGGHRTFRPSALARELSPFGVVNIGAAGTFVVRNPVSRTRLRAEIARRMPFETDVMICDGADIVRLAASDVFAGQPDGKHVVRFVSVMGSRRKPLPRMPLQLPSSGEWSLRVLSCRDQFVCGLYRRDMRAVRYLGQLDKVLGVSVTTRNWNTIRAIAEMLQN